EAADMILMDDNFASIVRAVEEGRTIYNNIRKVVCYLLSCNIGEILVIFFPMLLGMPVPLTPIHLLAINLITDAFPAFALGMEEKEKGIMDAPPRDPKTPIIDKKMRVAVAIQSLSLALGVLGAFVFSLLRFRDEQTAKTVCFFTLVVGELLRAYTARSETTSIFAMKKFSNKYLNQCVIASIVFLLCSVYLPYLNTVFGNAPLHPFALLCAVVFAFIPMLGGEISKILIKTEKRKGVSV
ncbi:MAG: cation transporting ATPase C-terminal domain-containing protein, partial [Clostridiales bacterium]|nr:cation transporting ATPase C-terminal domain-containing protein [Clostridiales bacterium]